MHSNNKFRLIAVLALALAGMALVASQAVAHGGHGRGDRQARLDSDRDSASNRCETQAGLDSANTDSDGNGTIDGLEDSDGDGANNAAESRLRTNCGVANTRFKIRKATVKSYSAEDGLVLAIGKRGLVKATVSEKLVCEQDDTSTDSSDDTTASISRHGEDDEAGDDRGSREDEPGDDRGGDRPRGDDRPSGDDHGDDDENDTVACTTADLTEGASVLRAKIKNGAVTRLHLAAADEGDF